MKTITFYSYKGGTGRTLLLANVAKFLAWCGQTVAVLDLDLEAPGLHYKLSLIDAGDGEGAPAISEGLIDYLLDWQEDGREPRSDLSTYFKRVDPGADYPGKIFLFPAGNAPSVAYAERLIRLDWWRLLYQKDRAPLSEQLGARAFAKIKDSAQDELGADFLLIDSRTGITDIGGIALNLLPDFVVCTMLSNRENIDGIGQVIKNLAYKNSAAVTPEVQYMVLLSRFDESMRFRDDQERRTVDRISDELLAALPESAPGFQGLTVLHTDRDLEFEEALRFDGTHSPNDSLLVRDYFRVFALLGLLEHVPSERAALVEHLAGPLGRDESKVVSPAAPLSREEFVAGRIARGRIAEWPTDPWYWASSRVKSRISGQLIYLPPYVHRVRKEERLPFFRRFMKGVTHRVGREIGSAVREKEASEVTWGHFVASGLLEGEFEICGEPLFLTWARSHLVGIVQFGWMRHFTLMVSARSPLIEILRPILENSAESIKGNENKGEGAAAIARLARALLGRGVSFDVGVVGEGAACAECMHHLAVLLEPHTLQRKGSEQDLREWLKSEQRLRDKRESKGLAAEHPLALAVCDINVAETAASRNELDPDARELEFKIRHSRLDPTYNLPFMNPVPVGIPYPAGDRKWRRTIARALLGALKDTAHDWDGWDRVRVELERAGIEAMAAEDLRKRLLLDLPFKETLTAT